MGEHTFSLQSVLDHQKTDNQPYSPSHLQPNHHTDYVLMRNGQNLMLPTTTAPENTLLHPSRQHHSGLTPISAVSSFNVPAQYDNALMTPVSVAGSPSLSIPPSIIMSNDRQPKLEPDSPSIISPYNYFGEDDKFPPMKHKYSSTTTGLHHSDSGFPEPAHCIPPNEVYYGSYLVSSSSATSRTMESTPSLGYDSGLNSAGSRSNGSYHHQTPPLSATSVHSFKNDQIPILGAPNPSSLRSSRKSPKSKNRPSSVHSNHSSSSSTSGQFRVQKKTTKKKNVGSKRQKGRTACQSLEGMQIPDDINENDRLLLSLRNQKKEWKEIVTIMAARTQEVNLTPACLQMRKKRLVDRIRAHPINAGFPEPYRTYHTEPAPRQTSSPRNWVDARPAPSTYYSSASFNSDYRGVTPRVSSSPWADTSSPTIRFDGLPSAHSSITMDEVRSRSIEEDHHHHQQQRQNYQQRPW